MNLLKPFRKKMRDLGVQSNTPLLIAVSGGMDSMVLLNLAVKGGFNVSVAHVNFKLRDAESDADQEFVKKCCKDLQIPFYTEVLKVNKKEENVQIAARELRYNWFQILSEENGFEYVLTAHHQDDRIETFFINLLRGSGIAGLRSIPVRNKNILRPILQFAKNELLAYAEVNGIEWREDASNKETDYLRNRIRHGIAKDFTALSESANANLAKSMDFLTEANEYFENTAAAFIHSLKIEDGITLISEEKWHFLFAAKPLHKYVLAHFGFHPDQFEALSTFGESQPGRKMEGEEYIIYRDRNQFVLEPKQATSDSVIPINSQAGEIESPLHLKWETHQGLETNPSFSPSKAFLNFDSLTFPLLLRKWRDGDKFVPLGMQGSKKISDFLTDQKLSIPQKNKTYVLESGGEICWVVGMRIDNRFKSVDHQKSTFLVNLLKHE